MKAKKKQKVQKKAKRKSHGYATPGIFGWKTKPGTIIAFENA